MVLIFSFRIRPRRTPGLCVWLCATVITVKTRGTSWLETQRKEFRLCFPGFMLLFSTASISCLFWEKLVTTQWTISKVISIQLQYQLQYHSQCAVCDWHLKYRTIEKSSVLLVVLWDVSLSYAHRIMSFAALTMGPSLTIVAQLNSARVMGGDKSMLIGQV